MVDPKREANVMSETNGVDGVSKKRSEFLDSGQYTINGITRYERIFGRNYVSEGGLQSTQVGQCLDCLFCGPLSLS